MLPFVWITCSGIMRAIAAGEVLGWEVGRGRCVVREAASNIYESSLQHDRCQSREGLAT